MAISVSSLEATGSTLDNQNYTTGSISPAANSLLVVAVCHSVSGGATVTISGLSLTWTQQATVSISTSTRLTVATAQCGASPGSGALTLNLSATSTADSANWNIMQVTGHNAGAPVVQHPTNTGTGTGTTVTYATAATTNNRLIYVAGCNANVTSTPRTNWTELGADQSQTGPSCSMSTQWRSDATETSGSSTWSSSAGGWGTIGLEIGIDPNDSDSGTGTDTSSLATAQTGTDTSTGTESRSQAIAVPSPTSYDAVVVRDTPVSFWNDDTGTDLIGLCNLTKFNTPSSSTTIDGSACMLFNGTNQYAEGTDVDAHSVSTTGRLTFEAWIRPDVLEFSGQESTGYVYWAGKAGNGSNAEWLTRMYSYTNTELRPNRISGYAFNIGGGLGAGGYVQEPVIPTQWIHFVFVINKADAGGSYPDGYGVIYKNGVLKDQNNLSVAGSAISPSNGTQPFRMGTGKVTSYFKGAIAKAAIYNYELTAAQVRAHYAAMTAGLEPGSGWDLESLSTSRSLTDSGSGADSQSVSTGGGFRPANLTLTFTSPTQATLAWTSVAGATGYDIERNGVIIATNVASTSYNDTGVVSTGTYTYRVRAVLF